MTPPNGTHAVYSVQTRCSIVLHKYLETINLLGVMSGFHSPSHMSFFLAYIYLRTLGDSGFFRLQGIVKATGSGLFEDLEFISEGSD